MGHDLLLTMTTEVSARNLLHLQIVQEPELTGVGK